MRRFAAALLVFAFASPVDARSPVQIGPLPSGPVDGITDVAGVRVAHVTKVEGTDVRTGATGVIANDDTWNDRVAAAVFNLWSRESYDGALREPWPRNPLAAVIA